MLTPSDTKRRSTSRNQACATLVLCRNNKSLAFANSTLSTIIGEHVEHINAITFFEQYLYLFNTADYVATLQLQFLRRPGVPVAIGSDH